MKKLLKTPAASSLIIGFSCIFLAGSAVADNAPAAAPPALMHADVPPPPPLPPRMIAVVGMAKGEYEPDQAVISFSVTSRGKVLADTKKANDALLQQLKKVTEQYAVPKEKVVTSGVYISPEYNYGKQGNQPPQVVGYTVTRNMRITTKDLEKEEALLAALTDIKIDQVNNVEFQLSEPDKATTEVRIKAFNNAKAQAEALATAAGAKLGPAMSISTSGAEVPRPVMPMMMAKAMAADAAAPSVAPSMPGAITLTETVEVSFALQ